MSRTPAIILPPLAEPAELSAARRRYFAAAILCAALLGAAAGVLGARSGL